MRKQSHDNFGRIPLSFLLPTTGRPSFPHPLGVLWARIDSSVAILQINEAHDGQEEGGREQDEEEKEKRREAESGRPKEGRFGRRSAQATGG
jgi:hypothetical protein